MSEYFKECAYKLSSHFPPTDATIKKDAVTITDEAFEYYDPNNDGKLSMNEQEILLINYTKWIMVYLSSKAEKCEED